MSWNYRVIEFDDPDEGAWVAIHEVYYDEDGNPDSYSEDPAIAMSTNRSLVWLLDQFREALSKEVLFERDFETL